MVGLAFSGGGTRAAAFSFGVLKEIDATRIRDRGKSVSLLDRVDFVSGVSGGSVHGGLLRTEKRAALDDFRERFLLRNAEESLNTRVSMPISARDRRRHQRRHPFPALARQKSVRRRDLPRIPHRPAAAHLDQRLRHLQPHALRVRQDRVQRDVQRSGDIPDRGGGRGVGRGAGRVLADRARNLSGPLQGPAAGMDRAGARQPQRAAAVARLRAGDRALPRRLDEIHQAPGRRPGRQFRPLGLHHRAGVGDSPMGR